MKTENFGAPTTLHLFAKNNLNEIHFQALLLRNTCPPLANIPTVCFGEAFAVNMVRPKSLIELAVALICSSVINYKRQKKFYIAPVIYYENLVSSITTTPTVVLQGP